MMKECPFSSRSKCDIWVDYQVACAALQEAEELCSSNWKEITYLLVLQIISNKNNDIVI